MRRNQDLTWAQLALAANAPMLIKATMVDGQARRRRAPHRAGHRRDRRTADGRRRDRRDHRRSGRRRSTDWPRRRSVDRFIVFGAGAVGGVRRRPARPVGPRRRPRGPWRARSTPSRIERPAHRRPRRIRHRRRAGHRRRRDARPRPGRRGAGRRQGPGHTRPRSRPSRPIAPDLPIVCLQNGVANETCVPPRVPPRLRRAGDAARHPPRTRCGPGQLGTHDRHPRHRSLPAGVDDRAEVVAGGVPGVDLRVRRRAPT